MQGIRFEVPACAPQQVSRLGGALGVRAPLAQILIRRGLADPGEAQQFLEAGLSGPSGCPPPPGPDLEPAVRVILDHVHAGDPITVHGDYDVDGVCSTAVLVRVLRALGADVDWHLPDRAGDGYGLRSATIERLAARGTGLLLTVDCGVSAVDEVARARALGMDVVISDHHALRADGALPDAPIVHPAVCESLFPDLCATAVAFELACALFSLRQARAQRGASARGEGARAEPYSPDQDLDLVALATIADVVPLLGENRVLVRQGLRALASTSKPGLRALMSIAGVKPGGIDERTVAFGLAPRINAAGRLYRADVALELVLTEDSARAQRLASELDRANHERRETERRILYEAEAQVAQIGPSAAYVLSGERWHPGVIGIVASRLVERHHRPVLMISLDGESGRGSGRSIDSFDLLAGLDAAAEHLSRHGGHRAAVGLELARPGLEAFRETLCAYAARTLLPSDLIPTERVDAVLGCPELGLELAEELTRLAPFGRGNPEVSLLIRQAVFEDPRGMGEGKHVRFTVHGDGAHASAVAFGSGAGLPAPAGQPVDATFSLQVNHWNGATEPRLVLRNVRPAEPVIARGRRAVRDPQAELALF
jgi:single-stranded-DNA-specific exonuclease